MQPAPSTVAEEWKRYWPIVLVGFVGMSFAAVPLQTVAFFLDPVRSEFGWTTTQFSLGATIFGLFVIPLAPFAGALQDKLGPRRMAILGVSLCTAALISLSATTGSLTVWYAQWAFFGMAELPIKATVWLAIVSSMFVRGRGMAIAITLCGTAMSQTVVPLMTFAAIDALGWRVAYAVLGLGWGGTTLLLVLLFFRERVSAIGMDSAPKKAAKAPNPDLPGLTLREALRSAVLYRIAVALMIIACLGLAVVTHKVPILKEMGISRGHAALIAATAGISAIFGKLAYGWIYDRWSSTWIGVSAFALSALGFVLLLEPIRSPALIVGAMILFGVSSGGTLQAGMYLTAQYCGQRNFGAIFGAKSSFVTLGIGMGPLLSSTIVDRTGSYELLLMIAAPAALFAALLVFRLGAYPDWSQDAVPVDPADSRLDQQDVDPVPRPA